MLYIFDPDLKFRSVYLYKLFPNKKATDNNRIVYFELETNCTNQKKYSAVLSWIKQAARRA